VFGSAHVLRCVVLPMPNLMGHSACRGNEGVGADLSA